MDNLFFKVATQFSRTPSARNMNEGKAPGEDLRALLLPLVKQAISSGQKLIVDLDGTAGYGTSFLEEVFGGLVRVEKIDAADLKKHLGLISLEEPDLIEEIWYDIDDAQSHEN
ncbi:MAG: STAS-like domain-containing protein [Bacteroidales bacterium]|nr:STAS-like domain-containing protein [Bacteroidales bacterium]